MSRVQLFTGEKNLNLSIQGKIDKAVTTRVKGIPLSYIVKEREFFGRTFFVNEDTLIPRPETEILVEVALKIIDKYYQAKDISPEILDVGTGSGCIAVSLTSERPDCRMTALEISKKALRIARKNINFHGLQKKVRLLRSDLFSALEGQKNKKWDIIVANPPYIAEGEMMSLPKEVQKEPRIALNGGSGGTEIIDRILCQAPAFLKEEGWLMIEIGTGQAEILRKQFLGEREFKNISFIKDFTGIDRVLTLQKI